MEILNKFIFVANVQYFSARCSLLNKINNDLVYEDMHKCRVLIICAAVQWGCDTAWLW